MLIYGDIGFDVTPKIVADALKKSKAGTINVRISSGGGSAFDGLAIYNLLRASGRRIEVDIDGLAASAASVVAMAGDEVRISEAALLMIHNSGGGAFGHAEDLRDTADVMDKIDQAIAATYARKSGRPAESFRALMSDETWMTAQEAMEAGLVDRITGAQAVAASVKTASSWAHLPAEVKVKLQQGSEAAIVAREKSMSEEAFKALQVQLAALVAQVETLTAKAAIAPAIEADEPEAEIEIEPAVEDAAQAEIKGMFDAAVIGAFERFSAQSKLAPEAREKFVAACPNVAAFKAICALYESAPAIVATNPLAIKAPSNGKRHSATPAQEKFCADAGLNVEKLYPVEGSK